MDVTKYGYKWVDRIIIITTFILAIVIFFISIFIVHDKNILNYISIILTALIPFIVLLANKKYKWNFPYYIVILISIHLVCAVDLGTVFHFYDKIKWWDLAVHGLFGFIGSSVLYHLYSHFYKYHYLFLFVALFLMTVGLAGLWEVWEFLAGTISKEDIMRIQESIEAGHSPLYDTMTDIMITMFGCFIFDVYYYIFHRLKERNT